MITPQDKISIKDAILLTPNLSKSTASRYINMVREHLKKEKHQIVTIDEYCNYFGIKINLSE